MAAPDDPMLARLRGVRAEIDAAAIAAGRQPSEVKLLLATKTQPADRIITAMTAGYRLIGENRVQEVVAKAEELSPFSPETHFIGHLQANKINQLVDHISCLQTLDSVDLARASWTPGWTARERRLDVLIQVNVSGETTKSGVAPERALDLLDAVVAVPRLTVRGFMTIGLNSPDGAAVRAGYRTLASLRDAAIAARIPGAENATELSMGMSGDFADAIAEGATIVRLGSAIFGSSAAPDPVRPADDGVATPRPDPPESGARR